MGKIVGDKRHKRKNNLLQLDDYTAWTEGSEELEQHMPDQETLTPFLTPNFEFWPLPDTNQDRGLANFTSDLNDLDFVDDIGSMHNTDAFSNTGEFSKIGLLIPLNSQPDFSSQISSQSQLSASSRASSMSTESLSISSSTTNSRSTTDMATQIHELSQKLSRSPLALDEVLNVNASYLQSIHSDVSKLPTDPSRMSTILMIIICLTQVLALFEACISPSTVKALFDIANGPTLLLGSFQVDLESQRQMRIQIVQKELMKVFDVARGLMRALQQHPIAVGPQNQTYFTLMVDVQKRVRLLAHIVRNS
jgi:hypothetical protein